jgi:hypothetical protein
VPKVFVAIVRFFSKMRWRPLRASEIKEIDAESRRDAPPEGKSGFVARVEAAFRHENGATAAEKRKRTEKRKLQNLGGIWTIEALSDVKDRRQRKW